MVTVFQDHVQCPKSGDSRCWGDVTNGVKVGRRDRGDRIARTEGPNDSLDILESLESLESLEGVASNGRRALGATADSGRQEGLRDR